MRISDWSSDVCSSDLAIACVAAAADRRGPLLCGAVRLPVIHHGKSAHVCPVLGRHPDVAAWSHSAASGYAQRPPKQRQGMRHGALHPLRLARRASAVLLLSASISACSGRSEEHTSELQSLKRNWYAVF